MKQLIFLVLLLTPPTCPLAAPLTGAGHGGTSDSRSLSPKMVDCAYVVSFKSGGG